MGVDELAISNWEVKKTGPRTEYYPKIIEFLGYFPFDIDTSIFGGKIKRYRYMNGLIQEEMEAKVVVDASTISDWENNLTKLWRRMKE